MTPPLAALKAFSSLPSFYVIQLVQQNERIFYFCRFQQERKKMFEGDISDLKTLIPKT